MPRAVLSGRRAASKGTLMNQGATAVRDGLVRETPVGATTARKQRRAMFGLPLLPPVNAVAEIAIFSLAVLAIDWLVPAFDVNRLEPNPCWLLVLLLSLQYGTVTGLLAAGVSILLSGYLGFPEQDVGENLFVYLLRIWGQPMLWIAAAVLLGQFRMRQIAEKHELTHQLGELSAQRTAIAGYATNLRQRCAALERRLVTRPAGDGLGILQALAAAGANGAETIAARFGRCIEAALPGATAILYGDEHGALRPLAVLGPDGADAARNPIMAADPLYRTLIGDGLPASVLSAAGEQLLAGRGVVAVPVRCGACVLGIIVVESIDPQWLSPELPFSLGVIADSLAPALERELAERSSLGPAPAPGTEPAGEPTVIQAAGDPDSPHMPLMRRPFLRRFEQLLANKSPEDAATPARSKLVGR